MNRNRMKPKVLYVHPITAISGGEVALIELLERLDREQFTPIAAFPDEGALTQRVRQLGVDVRVVPLRSLKTRNPLPFISTVYSLAKLIRREKIDILHANSDLANQYGAVAAKLAGIPAICHEQLIPTRRAINRSFLSWADKVIAISQIIAKVLISNGVPMRKVTLIYHSVDIGRFSPGFPGRGALRQELGLGADDFLIGIVGRICHEKGHHVLMNALSQVTHSTNRKVCLAVVGYHQATPQGWASDAYLSSINSQIARLGLEDRVFFTGFRDDPREAYGSFDLLAVPGVWAEPFGKVQVEGMAMEKPVIASNSGASPEIIQDGVSGLLVPPGNADALASAILKVLENKELAVKLGKAGRKRVEHLFSAEKNLPMNEDLYRELLGIDGRRRG